MEEKETTVLSRDQLSPPLFPFSPTWFLKMWGGRGFFDCFQELSVLGRLKGKDKNTSQK